MNCPNRLSILRILCIPVLVVLMLLSPPWNNWGASAVFLFASFTDFLDGYLARKNHWITNFGKFIDPVADKLLVLSSFIMLTDRGILPGWVVVLILVRELTIDGLRLIAMTKNQVIAAGKLGKLKTVSQMLLIVLLLVTNVPAFSTWYGTILTAWVAVITLWSGGEYLIRNRSVLQ